MIFTHRLVVRYAETDQMGFVYYANYFVYFESARSELMREAGQSYGFLEKRGIYIPVIYAFAEYKNPAFYEDILLVRTGVSEIKNSSFTFSYQIQREDDRKLIVKGSTRHCCLNREMKPIRINEELLELLRKYQWDENRNNR